MLREMGYLGLGSSYHRLAGFGLKDSPDPATCVALNKVSSRRSGCNSAQPVILEWINTLEVCCSTQKKQAQALRTVLLRQQPKASIMSAAPATGFHRAQPTSTSEGPLGTFGMLSVQSRVVTPPRSLPLESFPHSEPCRLIDKLFRNEFEQKALEVASRHKVSTVWTQITSRGRLISSSPHHVPSSRRTNPGALPCPASRYDPLDSLPTLLIVVDKWTATSLGLWQAIVEEMKEYIGMSASGSFPHVSSFCSHSFTDVSCHYYPDGRIIDTPDASSLDISVEMVCEDLVRMKYLSALDNDEDYPRILAAWPEIKTGIHKILESYPATADCMTCVALFKLGFDDNHNNPKTVYVSLSYDSPEIGWPPVLARIQSLLDDYGLDLHAHMEHNLSRPLADFPLLLSTKEATGAELAAKAKDFSMELAPPLETEVNAGADIGACTYVPKDCGPDELSNPLVGTLGCWLEIKVQGRDAWQTVGLTNYHVVRPCLPGFHVTTSSSGKSISGPAKQDSVLWKADIEGLATEGTRKRTQVESPTRAKLNFSVRLNRIGRDKIRAEPNQGPDTAAAIAELEDEEEELVDFFNSQKHVLGRVCFASGYLQRTETNGRLDWALIRPATASRVGQNLLPTREEWRTRGYTTDWHPIAHGSSIKSHLEGTSIHQMEKGHRVYKVGSSTRCTVGEFDALKADCVIREERYMPGRKPEDSDPGKVDLKSTEFIFIGSTHAQLAESQSRSPFARWGDSGSVAWDRRGCAVGLLFRGHSPGQTTGWFTFMTPIEDVFESIKIMSKGKIEDIRFLGEPRPPSSMELD